MKFSSTTKSHLGHYVYALVDPRDKTIFYVGKATANNRALDHLKANKGEKKKPKRIREIRASGDQPQVEILRYGLGSAKQCFEVEAAVIDALGLENLTNEVRGHGVECGRQGASEVERLHGSKPVAVESIGERSMVFFINQTYSPTLGEQQLYDCTRQFWHNVSCRKRSSSTKDGMLPYPVGLAVVDSVVVRAYSIAAWFPAGTTLTSRSFSKSKKNLWEFVGQPLPDHWLTGKRLTKNGVNLVANQHRFVYIN